MVKVSSIGKYQIISFIEKGNSAVYKAYLEETNKYYAIKLINLKHKFASDQFFNEINILNQLRQHNKPQFIQFIEELIDVEVKYTDKSISKGNAIVLEYAENGCLFEFIADSLSFTETQARSVFYQAVNCVDELHKLNISHRDIKLENFLLDENFNIKLCDFGFSSQYIDSRGKKIMYSSILGTQGYLAPEIRKVYESYYDAQQIDIFALGVLLYVIAFQALPFENTQNCRWYHFIKQKQYEKFWTEKIKIGEIDQEVSEDLKSLFIQLVNDQPQERLTMKQLKQHSWFTNATFNISLTEKN